MVNWLLDRCFAAAAVATHHNAAAAVAALTIVRSFDCDFPPVTVLHYDEDKYTCASNTYIYKKEKNEGQA